MCNIAFITREVDYHQYTAGPKIGKDIIKACQKMGIRVAYLEGKGIKYFLSLAKLRLEDIDHVLLSYPNVPSMRYGGLCAFIKNFLEISLVYAKKKQFRSKVILLVRDLPIEQGNMMGLRIAPGSRWVERLLFSISDIIGVMNQGMEEMISQHYSAMKAKSVHYKFPPYFDSAIRKDVRLEWPIQVAFVGDLLEYRLRGVINSINEVYEIQYNFYGPNGEWLRKLGRSDIRYAGVYPPEEIGKIINRENHVALLLYDPKNEKITRYMSMAVTSKFMTYVFSGLPIITYSRYENIAKMIRDYNLGWIFDEPSQIPSILSELDENSYYNVAKSVTRFAESIVAEDYFGRFINTSLNKLSCGKEKIK